MSGPEGSPTKRDQRREMRRAQYQQRQRQRQVERERALRAMRIRRIALVVVPIVILAIIIAVVVFATRAPAAPSHPSATGTPGAYTSPATGETRDGLQCMSSGTLAEHYHAYLAIYVNGQAVTVPGGPGLVESGVSACDYPVHVHAGDDNVIHIESTQTQTFTLGQFFDIWGKPLSVTRMMQYTADASHPLKAEVFTANGQMTTYAGNPWNITLTPHETVVLLYNSPNVRPTPFTGWQPGE